MIIANSGKSSSDAFNIFVKLALTPNLDDEDGVEDMIEINTDDISFEEPPKTTSKPKLRSLQASKEKK